MNEINPQTPIPQEFFAQAKDYADQQFKITDEKDACREGAHWAFRHLSPSAAPAAGTRYPIPVKICNSCGGPVSNDPFERVIHEEGGYEYYFCKKCCDQNKHFKITLPSPPTPGA